MNHFLSLLGALLLPALLHAQIRLTGTVLGDDAEPLEGVTVAAGEDHRFGTWTDREGRFALSGLRAGPVRLRLSFIGHEPGNLH